MEKLSQIVSVFKHPDQVQRDSDGFYMRLAKPTDLEALESINKSVLFDVGIDNLRLFYETSPKSWWVVINGKEEIVGYTSYNDMANGITYGYQMIVREEYRGLKLTSKFFGTDWRNSSSIIGSVGSYSLVRYKFTAWQYKTNFFYGISYPERFEKPVGHAESLKGVVIKPIRSEYFDRLADFDEHQVVMVNRRKFLRSWAMPEDKSLATTLVAVKQGKTVGYGVLRKCSDYFCLSPVYAMEPSVAMEILQQLATSVANQNIFVPFPADCVTTMRFCTEAGLFQTATEMKTAGDLAWKYVKKIPMERVFAVHEYWPV